jgi:UDP-3-O-[3-hydroxymyristoyl] N-acetylglucosamine deacetylase
MIKQKTIKSSVSTSGVGIHSGKPVDIVLNPAKENSGIVFIRKDIDPSFRLPAIYENVKSTLNASTLGHNGRSIGTIEHLMAALYGLGIDNVEVEVYGPELPILDGSAGPFVKLIKTAGVLELDAPRSWLVVRKSVQVRVNGSFSEIRPSNRTVYNCEISYNHPLLESQSRTSKLGNGEFEHEIADARTFGFMEDIERLRSMGLAKGGSLDNAVVLDKKGVMNDDGLRWNDEFVRHKILDMVGDFALAGLPILGEVSSFKSGHKINHLLLHRLLSNPENFDVVDDHDLDSYYSEKSNPKDLLSASI